MIKCHLSKLMGEKRLSIADISRETGINRVVITRLYHETAIRVDLEAVEKICVFLECEIEDLFSLQRKVGAND